MFDTRAFGRGYPDWRPELRTFPEIVTGLYGGDLPDVILPAYQLSPELDQLRFFQPGLEHVPAAKAIVLSDFWNVTDNYPDGFLDWLDHHGITWVLCYFPRPVQLFAGSRRAASFVNLLPCFDPEIMNDWGMEKAYDVGFLGAGVTEHHPFYPERNAIHTQLAARRGIRYLSAAHPGYGNVAASPIVGRGFSRSINACRIFVTTGGIYRNPFPKYIEVLASRSMLMAVEPEGAADLGLVDGVNYVRIDTEDVMDKVDHYLARPELIDAIAEQGYRLAMERHTCYARAWEFYERCGASLRQGTSGTGGPHQTAKSSAGLSPIAAS
jgi:hypothetical protein